MVMPFSLANAPATFQAMMDKVLKGLDDTEVHYLADVMIHTKGTYQEQSGEHLVERCKLLEEERGRVEKEERCTWRTRFMHRTDKREEGPVGPEKKEEEDMLECFFQYIRVS